MLIRYAADCPIIAPPAVGRKRQRAVGIASGVLHQGDTLFGIQKIPVTPGSFERSYGLLVARCHKPIAMPITMNTKLPPAKAHNARLKKVPGHPKPVCQPVEPHDQGRGDAIEVVEECAQ
jgi:hypothetical protein